MAMVPRRVIFSLFCCFFFVLGLWFHRATMQNRCEMSYMRPSYENENVPLNDSPFSLLRYTGDRKLDQVEERNTHPVLFIPGHKGTFAQARSLGSHVRKLGLDLEVYALDFNEQPTALHAGLIWQQAQFTLKAIKTILKRHPAAERVLVVAHSLGGMVIRTALVLPKFPVGSVSTVITLASPHQAPPIHLDRTIDTIYEQLKRFWRITTPMTAPAHPKQSPSTPVSEGTSNNTDSGWLSMFLSIFRPINETMIETNITNSTAKEDAVCTGDDDSTCHVDTEEGSDISSSQAPILVDIASSEEMDLSELKEEEEEVDSMVEAVEDLKANARKGRRAKFQATVEKAHESRLQRRRFANIHLGNLTIVSIGGGYSDSHVPPSLTLLREIGPPGQAWHSPSLISCDHLALCWCAQLQRGIALGLMAAALSPDSPEGRLLAIQSAIQTSTQGIAETKNDNDEPTSLVEILESLIATMKTTLISLVSYRAWTFIPVWVSISLLSVSAPLLHSVLDIAPPSPLSPSQLVGQPLLHWPSSMLHSMMDQTLSSLKTQVPRMAWMCILTSFFIYFTLPFLEPFVTFDATYFTNNLSVDEHNDVNVGEEGKAWHTQYLESLFTLDMLHYCLKYSFYAMMRLFLFFARTVSTPSGALLEFVQLLFTHFVPMVLLYGVLILIMSLMSIIVSFLQFEIFLKINSKFSFFKPLEFCSQRMHWLWNKLKRKKEEASPGDISGDEMREEFRARKAAKNSVSSTSSSLSSMYLQPSEKKFVFLMMLVFVFSHLKSLNPFVLRGLFSVDFSFAQEVSLSSLVMICFTFLLLLSFITCPAQNVDHRRYQGLLVVTYTPLVALTYGSLHHSLSSLTYAIPNTPGIFFDSLMDNGFMLLILTHVFFARFRPLPFPAPLASGLYPRLKTNDIFLLRNEPSSNPTTPNAPVTNEEKTEVVLEGGWERCYLWRSGLTYYEHPEKGELMYCDGGPTAIFEETEIDLVQIGDGVYLGPAFKVVSDRSDEFVDMWDQSFKKKGSHTQPGAFSQQDIESVLDAALSNEYCWVVALLYAVICFLVTAGSSKAYHTFSALGVSAALFGLLHFRHSP